MRAVGRRHAAYARRGVRPEHFDLLEVSVQEPMVKAHKGVVLLRGCGREG